MNRFKLLSILLIFSLALTSCQKIDKKITSQTLQINFQDGDIPSLHPHHLTSHLKGYTIGKALYEGLTRLNQDQVVELAGAAKVDISSCRTKYLFTIRDHCWSNEDSVSAYHYEQAWKHALSPKSDCRRPDLFYVIKNAKEAKVGEVSMDEVGVKALDNQTLSVELAFPAPYFLSILARPDFSPLYDLKGEPSVFNGPFVLDTWKKDDRISLRANPLYWDQNKIILDKIEISMITDPNTVALMYEAGQLDWIGDPISSLSPEVHTSLKEKGGIKHFPSSRFYWLYLNTHHPLLSSSSIRLALSLILDREEICDHILIGDLPLYTPLPTALSLCKPHHDHKIEVAKELFRQGIEELNFSKTPAIELSYAHIFGAKNLAEYLKTCWEKNFGMKVQLKAAEWNLFRADLESGNFEIGGCFGTPLYFDQIELLGRFESLESWNFSQWEDQNFQNLVNKAWHLPQSEERDELLRHAEQILWEECPYIPLSNHFGNYSCRPELQGYIFDHAGCIDFSRAYFKEQ